MVAMEVLCEYRDSCSETSTHTHQSSVSRQSSLVTFARYTPVCFGMETNLRFAEARAERHDEGETHFDEKQDERENETD